MRPRKLPDMASPEDALARQKRMARSAITNAINRGEWVEDAIRSMILVYPFGHTLILGSDIGFPELFQLSLLNPCMDSYCAGGFFFTSEA